MFNTTRHIDHDSFSSLLLGQRRARGMTILDGNPPYDPSDDQELPLDQDDHYVRPVRVASSFSFDDADDIFEDELTAIRDEADDRNLNLFSDVFAPDKDTADFGIPGYREQSAF